MAINIAAAYLQGLEVQGQLNAAKERINAERQRTNMEAQARAETNARESAENTARIQTQKAYRDTELALQQQKIQQVQEKSAQQTRFAALKMAQQHAFNGAVASGVSVRDAMFKYPLASATAEVGLERQEGIQRRADTRNANVSDSLAYRKQHDATVEADRMNRPKARGAIGHMDITTDAKGDTLPTPLKSVPLDSPLINQVMGTNAPPGTGTNFGVMPPISAPKSPHPDGTILVNKKTGARAIVRGGVPVPIDQGAQAPAERDDDGEDQ